MPTDPTLEENRPIASLALNWRWTPKAGIEGISNINIARSGWPNLLFAVGNNDNISGKDATRNSVDLILKSKVAFNDGVQFLLCVEA